MQKIAPSGRVHFDVAHFAVARVDLQALYAERRRCGHRLLDRETEGFQNNADGELKHKSKHLRFMIKA